MSYDAILARSPSIIYQPGGVAGDLVVTSWAQVQKFISARDGAVIVYVDDSFVSPALVPGATGITACDGRVELRPYNTDSLIFTILQVEAGATLEDLYAVSEMELRCNPTTATPSLAWTIGPNGGFLFLTGAILSNAATATTPAIVVPVGKGLELQLSEFAQIVLNAPSVPLINVVAGSSGLGVLCFDASSPIDNAFAAGGGGVSLVYDLSSATQFAAPFAPPTLPGITGGYIQTNLGFNPQLITSIIYQPGGTSSGDIVATWPEVQMLLRAYTAIQPGANGKFILYVDDSMTSPALVPGTTGVTNGLGRLEIRPAVEDPIRYTVLQIEPGATIANLYAVSGIDLRSNAQTATPSLSWTLAPNGGFLYVLGGAVLSNATTATTPAIVVPAGKTVFLQMEDGSTIVPNAPAVSLVSVSTAVTSNLTIVGYNAGAIPNGYASGPGNVTLLYDNVTAFFFPIPGTPPTLLPGLTGTYTTTDIDFSSGSFTLTGNVNGPTGANRFLALVHNVNDADFAVTEVEGWTWIEMGGLTANRTVTLPAAPVAGEVVVVTDGTASLESFNILIDGNGTNVQGAPIYTMTGAQNGARGSVALVFDGLDWFIFSSYTPGITGQTFVGPGSFTLKSTSQDMVVFVDTSGGAVNLTLPAPLSATSTVQRITFRDLSGTFGTNALTLTPPGAILINGANTPLPINASYPHIVAETNGMNYFV